jgi:hypothetical protein
MDVGVVTTEFPPVVVVMAEEVSAVKKQEMNRDKVNYQNDKDKDVRGTYP